MRYRAGGLIEEVGRTDESSMARRKKNVGLLAAIRALIASRDATSLLLRRLERASLAPNVSQAVDASKLQCTRPEYVASFPGVLCNGKRWRGRSSRSTILHRVRHGPKLLGGANSANWRHEEARLPDKDGYTAASCGKDTNSRIYGRPAFFRNYEQLKAGGR